jgi:hypothetical protein
MAARLSKNGKRLGRPVGSKGVQVANYVRNQLERSMQILERRDTPLSEIIANRLAGDNPERMLSAIAQFLPRQDYLEVEHRGDALSDALANVQTALSKQRQASGEIIDAEFVETSED